MKKKGEVMTEKINSYHNEQKLEGKCRVLLKITSFLSVLFLLINYNIQVLTI